MNDNNSEKIVYSVLYTTDKHKKLKKWHDGTVRRCNLDNGKTVFKLFGSRPCDLDDDPWDHEAGREKKGYRVSPLLGIFKVNGLEVGQEIQTGKYLITIDSLLNAEYDNDLGGYSVKRMKSCVASFAINTCVPESIDESECAQNDDHPNHSEKKGNAKKEMIGNWYEMVYTTDKMKKAKKWIDGFLEWDDEESGRFWSLDRSMLLHKQYLTQVEQGQQVITGKHIFEIGSAIKVSSKSEGKTIPREVGVVKSRCMPQRLIRKTSKTQMTAPTMTQNDANQQNEELALQSRSLTDLAALLHSTSAQDASK